MTAAILTGAAVLVGAIVGWLALATALVWRERRRR
jgi:hypothetical protein